MDWRGCRVNATMGLENVGQVLALNSSTFLGNMIATIHRTLNHDDTTTNNKALTADLQIAEEVNK
jgi:hypothetical protein